MTLVATWVDWSRSSDPCIWTISDSKIIGIQDATTITEQAAKLLELPIVCKSLAAPFPPPYFQSSIGFGFAGNTLFATNVHATLGVVLRNLGSSHHHLPNHLDIIEKARVIMQEYSSLYMRKAEVCLYGLCPQHKVPFIAFILPIKVDGVYTYTVELKPTHEDKLVCNMLGNEHAKTDMKRLLHNKLIKYGENRAYPYWRVPIFALRDLLLANENEAIGGELQMTLCSNSFFDHFWVPPLKESERSQRTLRGIDLDKIGSQLGGCHIAIYGMDYMLGVK